MTTARRSPRLSDLRRPQLAAHAPVLTRREDEWQVGLEPGEAVVLTGSGLRRLLGMLDGRHWLPEVRAEAQSAGLRVGQLDRALTALLETGLLCDGDAAPAPSSAQSRIRLVGAGPVGRQLAGLLVDSGVESLHVFDEDPPDQEGYPAAGALGSRALALCSQLERSRPAGTGTRLHSINHWSKPDDGTTDLTVLTAESPEIDRLITDHLLRHDQPHLLVRGHGRAVRVGPLVVPGRTSCLRCADLSRRDLDPHWPTVLSQLTGLRQPIPPALVAWAAAVATVQVLSFLSGGAPETLGATLEVGTGDHAMRLRSWPAHPACGCGWMATTE